jgi:hypothetical protein
MHAAGGDDALRRRRALLDRLQAAQWQRRRRIRALEQVVFQLRVATAAAAGPACGPPVLVAVFRDAGPLGIKWADRGGVPVIAAIVPGLQAAGQPGLRPGLLLEALCDVRESSQVRLGMGALFAESWTRVGSYGGGLEAIRAAGRPLKLRLRDPVATTAEAGRAAAEGGAGYDGRGYVRTVGGGGLGELREGLGEVREALRPQVSAASAAASVAARDAAASMAAGAAAGMKALDERYGLTQRKTYERGLAAAATTTSRAAAAMSDGYSQLQVSEKAQQLERRFGLREKTRLAGAKMADASRKGVAKARAGAAVAGEALAQASEPTEAAEAGGGKAHARRFGEMMAVGLKALAPEDDHRPPPAAGPARPIYVPADAPPPPVPRPAAAGPSCGSCAAAGADAELAGDALNGAVYCADCWQAFEEVSPDPAVVRARQQPVERPMPPAPVARPAAAAQKMPVSALPSVPVSALPSVPPAAPLTECIASSRCELGCSSVAEHMARICS